MKEIKFACVYLLLLSIIFDHQARMAQWEYEGKLSRNMNDVLIRLWWDSDACDVNQWDVYHSSADTDIQWSKYHSISPIICDPLCENPVKKSF